MWSSFAARAALLSLCLLPCHVHAQMAANPVERNLPPADAGGGGLTLDRPQNDVTDDTPFGVDLAGISLIGLDQPLGGGVAGDVELAGVDGIDGQSLRQTLMPFLGRPLSRALVAGIQSAVAGVYRDAGLPFVSVTAPPQDVSTGLLRLRVIPFRTGVVTAKSGDGADQALADKIRAVSGQLIDADLISEDLDWLNRFPYRRLNGVFEPGSTPGTSDLGLDVTRDASWRVFAGWSNTGTRATDRDRYFLGFNAGAESLGDVTLSYQVTGSGNFVRDPASVALSGTHWPAYVSHAVRVVVPVFARQSLEFAPNFVASGQESGLFAFQTKVLEVPVTYRSALSNLWSGFGGWGDVYGGVSPKWLVRRTMWDGQYLADGGAAVLDGFVGWTRDWRRGDGGQLSTDLRLFGNPGGVLPGNTDRKWSLFTNGRVSESSYGYVQASVDQRTELGWLGLSWTSQLTAQGAGQALPDTEQLSLGGFYAVRGYTLEDGSVDVGAVLRNEIRLPAVPLASALTGGDQDGLVPFLFADLGRGHAFDVSRQGDVILAGIGAGFDYRLADNLAINGALGAALSHAQQTKRGDLNGQIRAVMSF